MKTNSQAQAATPARRNFLIGAGVTAVAAGAVATTAAVKRGPVKTSKSSVPQGMGYQESAHVRNYYRTTLV